VGRQPVRHGPRRCVHELGHIEGLGYWHLEVDGEFDPEWCTSKDQLLGSYPGGEHCLRAVLVQNDEPPIEATVHVSTPDCGGGPSTLCLNDARFAVDVVWDDFDGNPGVGQPVQLTSDTGYFWFFDDANVEFVIKVLDGTAINGHKVRQGVDGKDRLAVPISGNTNTFCVASSPGDVIRRSEGYGPRLPARVADYYTPGMRCPVIHASHP